MQGGGRLDILEYCDSSVAPPQAPRGAWGGGGGVEK